MEDSLTLFRYRPINDFTFSEIRDGAIYFQVREKLNDPLDCNVDLKTVVKNLLDEKGAVGNGYLKKLRAHKSVLPTFRKNVGEFGISCFTRSTLNMGMWEKYAGMHTGICITYNIPLAFLDDDETFLGAAEVNYKPERIGNWLRCNAINAQHDFKWFITELVKVYVTSKTDKWACEEEYRIIRPKVGLYQFPKESITQITFGRDVSQETIDRIRLETEGRGILMAKVVPSSEIEGGLLKAVEI